MFLTKLFKSIGQFFSGLFNAAAKTWAKLSPEIQAALLHGSGVVQVINSNIDAAPPFVLELIKSKFPDLTPENIKNGLGEVSKGLGIATDINNPDLLTMIGNLQKYLATQKGEIWAGVSHAIASIFAIATAPPGTKFAVISSLMEYVYRKFIKHD